MTAPEDLVNPELGESFRGIERYLSTALVEATIPQESLMVRGGPKKVIEVDKSALVSSKKQLSVAVEQGAIVGAYATKLVSWIDDEVYRLLSTVPVDEFLR